MANAISVTITANASQAAASLGQFNRQGEQLTGTFRRASAEMRSFESTVRRVDNVIDRMAASYRRLRTEIEQTNRAQARGGLGGRLGGLGGYAVAGLAGAAAGAVAGALSSGVSTGFSQLLEESRASGLLGFTAGRTGYSAAGQFASADALRSQFGLTRAQSFALQSQTLRFTNTIGQGQNAGRLGGALANALAASGRSTSEIPIRLQQLQTGQDELFDVLGPVKIGSSVAGSPEQIYKAYAREILGVKRELTDLEKQQARYYAVLQAGDAAHGAAEARLKSLAGSYELLSNRVTDLLSKLAGRTFDTPTGRGALGGAARAVEDFSNLLGSNDPNSGRSILNLSPVFSVFNQYGRLRAAPNAGGLGAFATAIARNPSALFSGAVDISGAYGGPAGGVGALDAIGGAYEAGRGLFGQGFAALRYVAAQGQGAERAGLLDRRLALLRGRRSDPYGDIYLRSFDEENRISDALASGRITGVQAAAERRFARGERALGISERREDLTSGLEQQLTSLRSRFTGTSNPIAQIAAESRLEFARLARDVGRLGPEFAGLGGGVLLAQQQGAAFNLGAAGASNLANAAGIEARIAQLQGRTSITGYRRGRYGQLTNEPIFTTSYGESTRERIDRIFRTAGDIQSRYGAGLQGPFDASQATTIAGRFGRQYQLSALAQFRPEDFTPDQRRRYEETLNRAREDELAQAAEALIEMRNIAKAVTNINTQLFGTTGDEALKADINVNLEDRAEGADFRFKNRLFATGDTLTNQL
jgi:hypothetical protein